MTGLRLAQYRIDSELGRGGMGIVYRATDTKLDRTVALKVLPPHALASEDDRARFYREAKAAAQLHHPHIATVFQIDEAVMLEEGKAPAPDSEKRPFIAMEFVDGESLADRIAKGPMKLEEVVRIMTQVAEALGSAHEAGIVHRDVKSGNVMLTKKGDAKVLDFGLAKTAASTQLTRQGSTLGTMAYMSPEQARGEPVDARTDLWALGVVLYEMIAGRLPFLADYEQATLYGILNEDPEPLTAIRTGVPMELESIVHKLLRKDARQRYQTTGGLLADLSAIAQSPAFATASGAAGSAVRPSPSRSPRVRGPFWRSGAAWSAVGGLMAGALLAAFFLRGAGEAEPSANLDLRLHLPGFDELITTTARLSDGVIALSPDGRLVAYDRLAPDDESSKGLVIQDLTRDEPPVELSTLGYWPTFSPDSRQVVWTAEGSLFRAPVSGGVPQLVSDGVPDVVGMSWAEDGFIYVATDYGLGIVRLSVDTGEVESLTTPDTTRGEIGHVCPTLLPDGRSLLYAVYGSEGWEMALSDLESGRKVILGPGICPRFSEPDRVWYNQGYRLMVARLDVGNARLGSPATLSTDLLGSLQSFSMHYSVSREGDVLLVEDPNGPSSEILLTRFDGSREAYRPDVFDVEQIAVSPDGRTIAMAAPYPVADPDIYLFDRETKDTRRIASGPTYDAFPAFAPDGSLIFSSERRGQSDVYRVPPGSQDEQLVSGEPIQQYVRSVSPDGAWIGIDVPMPGHANDLYYVALDGTSTPQVFVSTPAEETDMQFSPAADLVAYVSEETGTEEIFVQDFPPRRPRERITVGGGSSPRWSRDGRFLYYVRTGVMYRVEVSPTGRRVGEPEEVLRGIWGDIQLLPDETGVLSIMNAENRTLRYVQRAGDVVDPDA